jgi:hypothetical protein
MISFINRLADINYILKRAISIKKGPGLNKLPAIWIAGQNITVRYANGTKETCRDLIDLEFHTKEERDRFYTQLCKHHSINQKMPQIGWVKGKLDFVKEPQNIPVEARE